MNKIPDHLLQYKEFFILFEPLKNISTAFISQYIRILYPSILQNYEKGILITDIDIVPLNDIYFTKNIENIDDDSFISLRNILNKGKQIAICYNIATAKVWSDVFKIKNLEEIISHIQYIYGKIKYDSKHGGSGWYTDQVKLYNVVMDWNKKTGKYISFNDMDCNFKRLCRSQNFKINNDLLDKIKKGYYSDYHALRPYHKFKIQNEIILQNL